MVYLFFFTLALEMLGGIFIIGASTLSINDTQRAIDRLRYHSDPKNSSFELYDAALQTKALQQSFGSTRNVMLFVCLLGLSLGSIAAFGFEWYDSISLMSLLFYLVTAFCCTFFLKRNFKKYYGDRYGDID